METWPLASMFLGNAPAGGAPSSADLGLLEHRLREAHAEAQAVWFGVRVDGPSFAGYLGARVNPELGPLEALSRLPTSDLYLTCGCARGDARAISSFERVFLSRVSGYTRRIYLDDAARMALLDQLRERLFVGDGQRPKIADYSGRGSLEGWVRVTTVRLALDLVRGRADPAPVPLQAQDAALIDGSDPEAEALRKRYAAPFQDALEAALAMLSAEDRAMLRLYFLERLRLEQISALLRLDKSNVSRRLARARARVLHTTRALLLERLAISESVYPSLLRAVRSALHLTLPRLLREEAT